ncbi:MULTISPECIES: NAD(P)H-binding protein [unclassified Streptomyces]|uniref:NAD(P)H-binding protein n=1 Tax=unclassified Streptomyces TaxID=2593676 RepID=UPI00166091F9|nr:MULTISPECIES: NAD(P)H-binding protein [unclassified Streptomyces]MBD0708887.1 NmrA family transcriptional regulator [Streptomyces sp. CBMA291]MBD0715986.1 NmrA family transcriptional regulator [Streptomyces sp. CBMA370]
MNALSSSSSVLVTGATGHVGREVVARLAGRGPSVRRFVRRPAGPSGGGTGVVVGDLTDGPSVRAALRGVDAVFLVWPLLDSAPAGPLVAELAAVSPHVVYLSSTAIDGAARRQSDPIVQVHADMEALLRGAGLRLTVLRSDTLASNTLGWAHQLCAGDVVSGPDMPATAVVDERDVAAAVTAVLLGGPGAFARDTYALTGPALLRRAEQVGLLGAALGRDLRFEAVPAALARARMRADGRPEALVEALAEASLRRPASALVTGDVELLTGRPPGSFARWVRDRLGEFPSPGRTVT